MTDNICEVQYEELKTCSRLLIILNAALWATCCGGDYRLRHDWARNAPDDKLISMLYSHDGRAL